MIQLTNTTVRFGKTDSPQEFQYNGSHATVGVKYDPTDPTFSFDPAKVRIIVTPNNEKVGPSDRTCTPAVCVRKVEAKGFLISAFNTDTVGGFAGFNWMAIAEVSEKARKEFNTDVGIGVVQPQWFNITNAYGDWNSFGVPYSKPFASAKHGPPIALLTGNNFGHAFSAKHIVNNSNPAQRTDPAETDLANGFFLLQGLSYETPGYQLPIAAVPVVTDAFTPNKKDGLTFIARNQDDRGQCGFYYAALAIPDSASSSISGDIWVEGGLTPFPHLIGLYNTSNAIQYWHMYFSQPFATAPVVMVTANDLGPSISLGGQPPLEPAHAVAQVHDVTPYGFTLVLRATQGELRTGMAHWVAFGCGLGCG
jgi:hypothetical protein